MSRQVEMMNNGWSFHLGDDPDAWQKWYQPEGWREVDLPHDWSVEGPFSKEYSSGTGYLQGGTAWYRKTFELDESDKGKKVFILFEGVYKNSQVWCNSYYLGKRPYGYIPFIYDISDQVIFGKDNLLAVRVEHEDVADSRWFTGSGMTRGVKLFVMDPVYIPLNGVFFTTEQISDIKSESGILTGKAAVNAEIEVKNDTAETRDVAVKAELAGAESSLTVELKPGELKKAAITLELEETELWSPEQPALHELKVSLSSDDLKHEQVLSVGVREFKFDTNKGFFVNGENTKMKGVCVHHDAGTLGAAVPADVWRRRMMTLKEMGCNAIRTSHNPHDPALYQLCDELGFFCLDEIYDEWEGPKNKWSTGHNVYPPKHDGYYHEFPQWYEQDVEDWIRRGRNHASIFAWSMGNEIDYPNDPYNHPMFMEMTGNNDASKPAEERQYNAGKPNAERLVTIARRLVKEARKHDATRPITLGAAYPELSAETGLLNEFDLIGYNYKEHLYEKDHARFPDLPFYGSENSKNYKEWLAVEENDYISGQFLWTGIDFLGEAQGWPIRCSGAGLITMAGFPKEEFFYRQSMWLDEPVMRLSTAPKRTEATNHWQPLLHDWNYTPGQEVLVRAFTNAESAELFINGKSHGLRERDPKMGFMEWIVVYEAGELSVVGRMADGSEIKDSVRAAGRAAKIELAEWQVPNGQERTDKDFTQVEVSILDTDGNLVPDADPLLWAKLTGDAVLKGMESGDIMDLVEYSASYRRTHQGRMIIYIKKTGSGSATLTLSGGALQPATLTI